IRAYTVETVIGLLWSTRSRPSEPIKLTIADVNLEQQLLHIQKTKFSKERIIPIDDSVSAKLQSYKQRISNKLDYKMPYEAFFIQRKAFL
ncbi:tyrosine-type recombinase/integrase, partial [Enterocloster lavalensis]|uniref:tyrosine-type recombinase/integrase n=1 Tax=Enterocloster lavalensis TaxID=460384 RepID=UPI0034A5B3E4